MRPDIQLNVERNDAANILPIGGARRQGRVPRVGVVGAKRVAQIDVGNQSEFAGALQFLIGRASRDEFCDLAGLEIGEQKIPALHAARPPGISIGETLASIIRDSSPELHRSASRSL